MQEKSRNPERRFRRSKDALEALTFLLDSLCTKYNLVSLVLGDDQGLLVAGSSHLLDSEEIAARAPLVAKNFIEKELNGWPLQVWKAKTGDEMLQFCGVGSSKALAAATLNGSRAVRRILA